MSMSNSIIFIFHNINIVSDTKPAAIQPFPPGCLTAGFMHYLLIRVQRNDSGTAGILSELLFNPQSWLYFATRSERHGAPV